MSIMDYLKDKRIISLIVILLILGAFDYVYGIHLGIEFAGGTQIPVTFEHSVPANETSQIISILQQRLSTFGLKEITIEGIGNSQVLVQIPSVSQSDIQNTVDLIQSQGVFQGIVNGKVAIDGSGILSGSVGAAQPTVSGNNVSWSVNFYITQQAAVNFAKIVFGQANKPLFMFLDRPSSAIVLINSSLIGGGSSSTTEQTELNYLESAVALGNKTIPIEIANPDYSNWNSIYQFFKSNKGKYSQVMLSNGTPQYVLSNLTSLNYSIEKISVANMTPSFSTFQNANLSTSVALQSWPAVGLLSAPVLNSGVTNGSVSQGYIISGFSPPSNLATELTFASTQSKLIESVLNGGALPVHVIVGQPTVTPPTLGKSFETISEIALLLAVIAVSIVIAIRYKRLFLIAPIILTTLAELFIIISVIGVIGTIDLSAIAGMIAVIGTGVDAQIIITDEVLNKSHDSSMKIKLSNAFYIVWADAALLIIAMLPLFFSTSLVTVIGFSESTIIGALLGAFITRPSYGAIVSRHYGGSENA
jgi:preprotein translocase subunit SecD